jgi:hypothetical protein
MNRKIINESEIIIFGGNSKKPEANPNPEITHEITIKDLADELGILPKSLRSRLRKNGYKKSGKTWGWSKNSPELAEIRNKFKN